MKFTYDKIADAAYMTLRKGKVSKTIEMSDNVIIDLDKKGNLLGIEMLSASKQLPKGKLNKKTLPSIPVEITSRMPVAA
jgi:uncharacterized protein YuzE